MTNLLLTGANGFVGGHLQNSLRERFQILPWTGQDTAGAPFPVSLTDATTFPDRAACGPVQQVIHAAALTKKANPDPTPPGQYQAVNVDGTRALLAWLDGHPLTHVLYLSTCDVYGSSTGEISEDTPPAPGEPYAASKLAGEDIARAYAARRGIPCAVARLGNVYGPGEGAYGKLIPVVLGNALAGRPIRLNGTGATRRDCVYVGDVSEALAWLAAHRLDGTFNIVRGRAESLATIARTAVNLAGSHSEIQLDATKPDGPDCTFAPSRLMAHGWQPRVELDAGLAMELQALRETAP